MSNLSNYLIEGSDGAVIHWEGNYTDKKFSFLFNSGIIKRKMKLKCENMQNHKLVFSVLGSLVCSLMHVVSCVCDLLGFFLFNFIDFLHQNNLFELNIESEQWFHKLNYFSNIIFLLFPCTAGNLSIHVGSYHTVLGSCLLGSPIIHLNCTEFW